MSADGVSKLSDDVGSGKQPNDFPLDSLRQKLLPGQLTSVQLFFADDERALQQEIDSWVAKTQNMIVVPGAISQLGGRVSLPVTYVPAYARGS